MTYLIYFGAVVLPWLLIVGLGFWFALSPSKIKAGRLIGLALISAILSWGLVSLFKYNFPHPRPFEVFDNLKPLFWTAQGESFPSGHAAFFGALALGLFWQDKKIGTLFVIGAVLIGVSRVLAHVHWPVDILASFVLALGVSFLVHLLSRRLIF